MLRIAERVAKKSSFKQHRVGAVIVKGNRVLSTGYNEIGYSKYIRKHSVHAEERAIVKLLQKGRLQDLVGSTIYVTRFTKSGKVGCAAPCERCQSLINSVGISRSVYSDWNGQVGEMRF